MRALTTSVDHWYVSDEQVPGAVTLAVSEYPVTHLGANLVDVTLLSKLPTSGV